MWGWTMIAAVLMPASMASFLMPPLACRYARRRNAGLPFPSASMLLCGAARATVIEASLGSCPGPPQLRRSSTSSIEHRSFRAAPPGTRGIANISHPVLARRAAFSSLGGVPAWPSAGFPEASKARRVVPVALGEPDAGQSGARRHTGLSVPRSSSVAGPRKALHGASASPKITAGRDISAAGHQRRSTGHDYHPAGNSAARQTERFIVRIVPGFG